MKTMLLSAVWAVLVAAACAAEEKIVVDGSTTIGPLAKAYAEYLTAAYPECNFTVSESGSGNGARSLVNGGCDVAAMSRPMGLSEMEAATQKGIQIVSHLVALDGVSILVHPSNPVDNLTVEQLRGIYTGRIGNWSELGGPDRPIVVISRDTNSGTYEIFQDYVMNQQRISQHAEYCGSNGAVRQRLQSTRYAIGYTGIGFVDETVKVLSVGGICPSPATVRSGGYPIARPLFMYTAGYPGFGSCVYRFVTLHLSRVGQKLVEEAGLIPVTDY